jgi:NADH dehydrogenase
VSVAVVGASGAIGRAAVRAFARADPDVRAVVGRAEIARELREAGARVAIGDLDDDEDDALPASVFGADSVCLLAGGPDDDATQPTNVATVGRVLGMARRAGVRRVLFVSDPGADAASPNPHLRAEAAAEEAIRSSGLEFAIVRTSCVYGVGGGAWFELVVAGATRLPPVVVGDPTRIVAPVFADDVADVLLAADDRAEPIGGTWAVQGPDRVTIGELVAALSDADAEPQAVGAEPAQIERLLGRPVSEAAVEVLTGSWPTDAPDAAIEFGVRLTRLAEGIRRIAAAARLER